ncbi:MAG: Hsp20/alpha crystallin family protein [Pseudomonadota bacterium]
MAIIRWTEGPVYQRGFLSEFDRLRNQLAGLLENAAPPDKNIAGPRAGVFPLVNIMEDADNFYLTAELPGVSPDQMELSFEKNSLVLRGERKIAAAEKKVNYHRREREAGVFRRVIDLSYEIDSAKASAKFKNGVLEVTLPKAEVAKPKQISVELG